MEIELKQVSSTGVQTSVGGFTVQVDRPVAKGGGGQGLVGGQYMLIGVGGCFCSTLFAAAQSRKVEITGLTACVKGELADDSPNRFSRMTIKISYERCSHPADFTKLLTIAERGCISANTIKHGVDLQVTLSIEH